MRVWNRLLPRSARGLLLVLLVVMLVPALLGQLAVYASWYRAHGEAEIQANVELARSTASLFSAFVQGIAGHELTLGVAVSALEPFAAAPVQRLLQASVAEHPQVDDFSWVTPQGETIASSDPKAIGIRVDDRPYFQEIRAGRPWVVSDIMPDRVDGKPAFIVARGLRNANGQLKNVVLASIDVDELAPVFAPTIRSAGGAITLFDRQGNLAFRQPPAPNATGQSGQRDPLLASALNGTEAGGAFVSPADNARLFAARTPVADIGWVAGASRPVQLTMDPIVRSMAPIAFLALLMVGLSVFLSMALYRRIWAGLKLLEEHAIAVGKGVLEHRVQFRDMHELNTVAEALNEMAVDLKSARNALREANLSLEQDVEDRTVRLRQANAALRATIEEFVKALDSLRTSEARLAEAQRIAHLGSWDWNIMTNDLSWSDELFRIFGLAAEEFSPGYPRSFEQVHPDDLARVEESVKIALSNAKNYCMDHRIVLPDNGERVVHAEGAVVFNETGIPARMHGTVLDITEHVKAEEEATIRQQQLIQADKMVSLGILVSGVAHEINNPNHSIMTNTAALARVWESAQPILDRYYKDFGDFVLGGYEYSESRDKLPRMFANVLACSKRIELIVTELRDFARYSPKEKMTDVDPNAVVKSAVLLLSSMVWTFTEEFSVEYGSPLPPVLGNFQRLEQVVINLIQNACHSLPGRDKGVRVSTSYVPERGTVQVEVSDEGIGIPEEALKHLGDPFFTTRRGCGGTGLGLWVSFSIVHEHGGSLKFFSKEGNGTRAVLALPADLEHPAARISEQTREVAVS